MGCCDSKEEPPEDLTMDFKTPRFVFVPLVDEVEEEGKCINFLKTYLEPTEIEGDEIIDFDFENNSTGVMDLTTYPAKSPYGEH
jgi:hypothetical protein